MPKTDLFLTHDWGIDEKERNNHERVAQINEKLKALGYRTWFDSDRMTGDIVQQMSSGIEDTKAVLVFLTKRYIDKVTGDNPSDNCKLEFNHAARVQTSDKMVCVVMEERCRDTRQWRGSIGMFLAGKLYVDMANDFDGSYLDNQLKALEKEINVMGIHPDPENIEVVEEVVTELKSVSLMSEPIPETSSDKFTGEYECHAYDNNGKNDWHYVTITHNESDNSYTWKNRANVSWTLYPKDGTSLHVGKDCGYYKGGHTVAAFKNGGVYGPGNEFYKWEREVPRPVKQVFAGTYECHLYDNNGKNNWHYATITHNGRDNSYTWRNRANVSWTLYPKNENSLDVGKDCGYYDKGYTVAEFTSDGVYGPGNEFYTRH